MNNMCDRKVQLRLHWVYVPVHVQTLGYVPSLVPVTVPAPSAQFHQLVPDNNTNDLSFSLRTPTIARRLLMGMKMVIVSIT
jgi:hypothetical protein